MFFPSSSSLLIRSKCIKTCSLCCRSKYTLYSQLYVPSEFDSKPERDSATTSRAQKLLKNLGLVDPVPGGQVILSLALRSLEKLIKLIDEEMESICAQKIIMPSLVPQKLFQTSGRLDSYSDELFLVGDQLLAPTHEEVVTNMISKKSDQLRYPKLLYQVTTKYRKEKRPKSGLLRSREFLMKDLYSFDVDLESANQTYEKVGLAYERIFERLELPFIKVAGDLGQMGGHSSHEYQVMSQAGEDYLFTCSNCNYACNQELLADHFFQQQEIHQRQERERNEIRERREDEEEERKNNDDEMKCPRCGKREKEGEKEKEGVKVQKGIEVGHTFLLGDRYSKHFSACFNKRPLIMGSYGIGVTRLLAAVVEVLSSDQQIKWPRSIPPFHLVLILPKTGSKEEKAIGTSFMFKFAEDISRSSQLDVLVDERPGMTIGRKDKDHVANGIPWRVILGKGILEDIPRFELVSTNHHDSSFSSSFSSSPSSSQNKQMLTHCQVISFFEQISNSLSFSSSSSNINHLN